MVEKLEPIIYMIETADSLVQLTIDVGLSSQVTVSEPNDDMTP
jgi:hypothetical protein